MGEECGLIGDCPDSLAGGIFLLAVYGYIVLQGANLLSHGSELLLEVLDPGLIGGLVLPVLGALPDTCIIVVSGLFAANATEAAEQIRVGIGTLAGSTIMLLTIAWGGSLLLGRCDLRNGRQVDRTLTSASLTATGVSTDAATPFNATIMMATCLLYSAVQGPALLGYSHEPHAALAGGVLCLATLAGYCVYQVRCPELQKRKMKAARQLLIKAQTVASLARTAANFGGLLTSDGNVRRETMDLIFDKFDEDGDGRIDRSELHHLVMGLYLATDSDPKQVEADMTSFFHELDGDASGALCKDEFMEGMSKWVQERTMTLKARRRRTVDRMLQESDTGSAGATHPLLAEDPEVGPDMMEDDDDDYGEDDMEHKEPAKPAQIYKGAILQLAMGTAICAYFSDSLVGAVTNVGRLTGIDAFFIAFIFTPLASNASELVSSLAFASRKRRKNISLTYSQVYGAVTMNNTLCLGIFLLIVWHWGLPWTYTAEVVVTVVATLLVGVLGMRSTVFSVWWAAPVLSIYPLSILGVWLLQSKLGLD